MKLEAAQRLLSGKKTTEPSNTTTAGPQYIPRGHMGNQLTLDTGLDLLDDEQESEAAERLAAKR